MAKFTHVSSFKKKIKKNPTISTSQLQTEAANGEWTMDKEFHMQHNIVACNSEHFLAVNARCS